MKSSELLTLILAAFGVAISLGTLVYTVEIGRRNNDIASENLKLASEQELIKRALRFDILNRMLSIYQSISDFGNYLWVVHDGNHLIDRNFVYDYYVERAKELTTIRSQAGYLEYLRALSRFKQGHKLSDAELSDALQHIGHISNAEKESFIRVFGGGEIGEVLTQLELNTWWSVLETAQKIKAADWDVADASSSEKDSETRSREKLLEGKDTEAKKEVLRILRVSLHTTERVNQTLALYKKFEPELSDYLDKLYGGSEGP